MNASRFCIAVTCMMFGWCSLVSAADARPNIILVMADDMGWGQTGYRNHPVLKTPNLDAMAAAGLRFERFYAGGPVCSPTRASVLTGRTHDRTGVLSHGYALRLQEKTIAQAVRQAGYVTGHFGKWHLNGLRGPGVPVLASDPRHPGVFGVDEWVSVTNFFDLNPLMSRMGKFEAFEGDSSEVTVAEAVKFIDKHHKSEKPLFAVIWFGTPHSPFRASPQDKAAFADLKDPSANHYGELVAMDRSMGTLRQRLRDLGIAKNTLLVFCSDNGGLGEISPDTVGGLRGNKGTLFEGGLRVPGIMEWPNGIKTPRVTNYPACVMDLFPTIADMLSLPEEVMIKPIDGVSLKPLFAGEVGDRKQPIGFRYGGKSALTDNRYKILSENRNQGRYQLYDLQADPNESKDVAADHPEIAERMKQSLLEWNKSVDDSFAGKDYPGQTLNPPDPKPIHWNSHPDYVSHFDELKKRAEYRPLIRPNMPGQQ